MNPELEGFMAFLLEEAWQNMPSFVTHCDHFEDGEIFKCESTAIY